MNQPTSTGASLAPRCAQIATASSLSGGQPSFAGATNWIAPLSLQEPMCSVISDQRPDVSIAAVASGVVSVLPRGEQVRGRVPQLVATSVAAVPAEPPRPHGGSDPGEKHHRAGNGRHDGLVDRDFRHIPCALRSGDERGRNAQLGGVVGGVEVGVLHRGRPSACHAAALGSGSCPRGLAYARIGRCDRPTTTGAAVQLAGGHQQTNLKA